MLDRLGIAEQVKAKAKPNAPGRVAQAVQGEPVGRTDAHRDPRRSAHLGQHVGLTRLGLEPGALQGRPLAPRRGRTPADQPGRAAKRSGRNGARSGAASPARAPATRAAMAGARISGLSSPATT